MTNPRDYPDMIKSAESGRTLRRGVKMLTITVDGRPFTYDFCRRRHPDPRDRAQELGRSHLRENLRLAIFRRTQEGVISAV